MNWGYRDLSSGVQDEVEKEDRKLKQEGVMWLSKMHQ